MTNMSRLEHQLNLDILWLNRHVTCTKVQQKLHLKLCVVCVS